MIPSAGSGSLGSWWRGAFTCETACGTWDACMVLPTATIDSPNAPGVASATNPNPVDVRSAYVTDYATFFDGRFSLLVGGRFSPLRPSPVRVSVQREGELSGRLGLPGWPGIAEEVIVARDVMLARHTGSRVHVAHVSTAGSVEVLRWAKAQGIDVTAEVTPHHLLLTTDLLSGYDPTFKVNPPLRPAEDVEALRAALGLDGMMPGPLVSIALANAGFESIRGAMPAEWRVDRCVRNVHQPVVERSPLERSARGRRKGRSEPVRMPAAGRTRSRRQQP